MKRLATRVLALVVALSVLLLPAAALAEGKNTAVLSIGNFVLTMGEQSVELPVTLQLVGGADAANERGMGALSLISDNQVAVALYGAVENGEVKAYLNGMNYGISFPLEQLIALINENMESAMGSMDSEMGAAFTELMEALAALSESSAEPDMEGLMAMLNPSMEDGGVSEVTIFGDVVSAQSMTFSVEPVALIDLFNCIFATSPEGEQFMEKYFNFLNIMLKEQGADMTMDQALSMINLGAKGTVYMADPGNLMIDLQLILTAQGQEETIELPLTIVVAEDETGARVETIVDTTAVGGDGAMDTYIEITMAEDGSAGDILYRFTVMEGTEELQMMQISISNQKNEAGDTFICHLIASEEGETMADISVQYVGTALLTEAADSYAGKLTIVVNAEGMAIQADMDVSLDVSILPDGELLTLPGTSVNPFEADEETMQQFMTDAQTALMQGMGVLMQNPTLAGLLGNVMG